MSYTEFYTDVKPGDSIIIYPEREKIDFMGMRGRKGIDYIDYRVGEKRLKQGGHIRLSSAIIQSCGSRGHGKVIHLAISLLDDAYFEKISVPRKSPQDISNLVGKS